MKKCKILINIDTLFDTRLGVLTKIYSDNVLGIIKNGYYGRKHDKFSLLDKAINDQIVVDEYKKRDREILKLSGRTNMVNIISTYISQSEYNKEHPSSVEYSLVINTFPFNLSKLELKELFTCFKLAFGISRVTRVHLDDKDITPELLKTHFNRFILYDFNNWYGHHLHVLGKIRIPHVNVVFPLLYINGNEESNEVDIVIATITNAYSSIMDIEFVSLADMSYCPPKEYLKPKEDFDEQINESSD